ncbi:hypothetical protein LO762_13265 [Actinocorallia sp. API 0066]|uniref:hypothetical protein n=1 Tax=Actinocorallia sp. API 0066 TaxID=2896846 RepID=UPI001E488AC4|nr:hypothetical protein [Actinocorallia sp. API 0066]MCD0450155.1 hypothetical protein [Actinocorallia sp. API 0066]
MNIAWENAHTGYGPDADRPTTPGRLAVSEAQWRRRLEETPNGWMLRAGSLLEGMTSGKPVHVMHTTTYLKEIRRSRQLYQAAGCLVGALYGAPLTPEGSGLRPHNLGTWLLESKPCTHTLVFEITPERPVPAKGVNYLRLGEAHLQIYEAYRDFLTPPEDQAFRQDAILRVNQAAPFLDRMMAMALGELPCPRHFLDELARAVPVVPFLGYLYFEVVAEYLMLHSTSAATKACGESGELNNRLYKQLAFSAVESMGHLFDLALFSPGRDRLLELVASVEPTLASHVVAYVGERLPHVFATAALALKRDAASVTFRGATYARLARDAPGLLGQTLFRLMRAGPRYPQLFPVFEQAKATGVSAYWNTEAIPVPFNGVIPKGEVGVNLAWPGGARTWIAERCPSGLLRPTEELDLTFVPRLADLRETALGRARFALPRPADY